MSDLSNFKGCAPAPVMLEGRFAVIEPYDRASHLQPLWDALGGATGINTILQYFPQDDFRDISAFGDWLENAQARLQWAIHVFCDRKSGKIAGMASYMRPDPSNGVVEIGAVAHGADMKRSPVATEAHYLLAKHIFETLGYRRYEWKCHNDNEPSKAAAIRYGFVYEGLFRQHMVAKGQNRDTAWFSMIDREWPLIAAAFRAWLAPENFAVDGAQLRRLQDIRTDLEKE